ncbi:CD209 antigen-like protein D isoform X2 [Garra rufa]|uniref:CD209 antigen-like protein D isoform X2 n=1 Tax=Garra rufa TaxID=137080 RepID=UPI003CCEC2BE
MSYYGNIDISGKRGMGIEYEEMAINSSDVQTESEYSDTKRSRTPQNTDQCSDNPKWITYKHSSYYISSEWKNWTESREDCLQRGADLIIINDKEEQDFITVATSANIVWIGLNEFHKEGVWKWVDGSTLTTEFWRHGEPNNNVGDEDCVVSHFHWADYPCDFTFVWICEKDLEV